MTAHQSAFRHIDVTENDDGTMTLTCPDHPGEFAIVRDPVNDFTVAHRMFNAHLNKLEGK